MNFCKFYVKPKIIACIVISFCYSYTMAQNLVNNPGFEDFNSCPEKFGSLKNDVPFWSQATEGSTDYFHNCSPDMPIGVNFIGEQLTYEGEGYAGMYVYGPKDYREYLTSELKEPLIRGKKYFISFQISLADNAEYSIKEFGVLFTKRPLRLSTKRNIPIDLMKRRGYKNYVEIRRHKYYDNKTDWVEISGSYIADGTESYMTIGNFKGNNTTSKLKTGNNLKKVSYYYVDMVSLKQETQSFNLDETYVLENLMFDTDGYHIKKEGRAQLEYLVVYLKNNPSYNISIYGHTDDVGSKTHNLFLSKKRAKAVSLFLVDNGLSSRRIAWKGYGDSNPMSKNITEKGRELNRRVEFVVSKKKREYYASSVFEDDEY